VLVIYCCCSSCSVDGADGVDCVSGDARAEVGEEHVVADGVLACLAGTVEDATNSSALRGGFRTSIRRAASSEISRTVSHGPVTSRPEFVVDTFTTAMMSESSTTSIYEVGMGRVRVCRDELDLKRSAGAGCGVVSAVRDSRARRGVQRSVLAVAGTGSCLFAECEMREEQGSGGWELHVY